MKILIGALQELSGLFVEDGALALAIVAVVGICTLLVPSATWATGAILLFGCIGVLFINVMKAQRRLVRVAGRQTCQVGRDPSGLPSFAVGILLAVCSA
jgi:hypothetical protein